MTAPFPTWPTSRPLDQSGALFVFAGRHPRPGDGYGVHGSRAACGGVVRWSWVPSADADPTGPGLAVCARCGAEGLAWLDAWCSPDEQLALEVAVADVADPDDDASAALPVLAAADASELDALVASLDVSTPVARCAAWDAWSSSDLYARLRPALGPVVACLYDRAVGRRLAPTRSPA